jgi:hypothetical protein
MGEGNSRFSHEIRLSTLIPNRLRGFSANSRIENIAFENVRVGGNVLSSLDDGFDVDSATVQNVTFSKTARPGSSLK